MFYYASNGSKLSGGLPLADFFSGRLQVFLSPWLVFLDQDLDRRLVSTFAGLCASIIRLRSRSTGLYLSELGSYLLSPAQAPAGTKRISNLLRSPRWDENRIINYLALQAQVYGQQLQAVKKNWFYSYGMRACRKKPRALKVPACVPCAAAKPSACSESSPATTIHPPKRRCMCRV